MLLLRSDKSRLQGIPLRASALPNHDIDTISPKCKTWNVAAGVTSCWRVIFEAEYRIFEAEEASQAGPVLAGLK